MAPDCFGCVRAGPRQPISIVHRIHIYTYIHISILLNCLGGAMSSFLRRRASAGGRARQHRAGWGALPGPPRFLGAAWHACFCPPTTAALLHAGRPFPLFPFPLSPAPFSLVPLLLQNYPAYRRVSSRRFTTAWPSGWTASDRKNQQQQNNSSNSKNSRKTAARTTTTNSNDNNKP